MTYKVRKPSYIRIADDQHKINDIKFKEEHSRALQVEYDWVYSVCYINKIFP